MSVTVPGQKWADGPCRECTCVGEDNFNHCTQCRNKMCTSVKSRNVTIGNTYYEYSRGPCCIKMKPVGCVHNNKIYRVGELWDIDQCTSMKCEREVKNKLTVTLEVTEICNEKCSLGFIYKKSRNTCCGVCVQDSCIMGSITKKLYERWYSEDGCNAYTCASIKGQYKVLVRKTLCPPVQSCPGKLRKGRCCEFCDTTELYKWKDEPTNCNFVSIPPAV